MRRTKSKPEGGHQTSHAIVSQVSAANGNGALQGTKMSAQGFLLSSIG